MLSRPLERAPVEHGAAGKTSDAGRLDVPASILNVRGLPGNVPGPVRCFPKQSTLQLTFPLALLLLFCLCVRGCAGEGPLVGN